MSMEELRVGQEQRQKQDNPRKRQQCRTKTRRLTFR